MSYCLRVLHVGSDIFTYSFQFQSRFLCPFNFLMTICSFCLGFCLRFFVFWVEIQRYRGSGGGGGGGGGGGRKLVVL